MVSNTPLIEARRVIDTEIQGLEHLKKSLGQAFEESVRLLSNCRGRVIFTGMGKSGHIATKIAATFASTGTPAFFVHPAEASHGDLGMIEKSDVVVALSNSGETRELFDILHYARSLNLAVVALTQQASSSLARQAAVVLELPKVTEACPIKLAPTTSTTMMLALGDALAMVLLKQKSFSPVHFKRFHPGGSLGNSLSLVSDLMRPKELVPLVDQSTLMADIILEISEKKAGSACVVSPNGLLEGVITDGDLRRHMSPELLEKSAKDVMSLNPVTIKPNQFATEAFLLTKENKITVLPVVDEKNRVLGTVDIHACIQAGLMPTDV